MKERTEVGLGKVKFFIKVDMIIWQNLKTEKSKNLEKFTSVDCTIVLYEKLTLFL